MSATQNVLTSGALRFGDTLRFPPFGFRARHRRQPDADALLGRVDADDWPYIVAFYRSEEAADANRRHLLPLFGSLICPSASAERSYWIMRQVELIAVMDDHFTLPDVIDDPVQLAALGDVYGRAVDGVRPSDAHPLAQLLHDTVRPVLAMLAPDASLPHRLTRAIHDVIDYLSHPVVHRMDALGFDEYLRIRRCETTAEWCALLVEFGIDVDMADALDDNADLREVQRAAADLIVIINDLGSFRREFSNDDALNGIWLLVRQQHLSVQQALDRFAALARETEDRLLTARDRVLASPLGKRDDVCRYMDELVFFYAGCAEFHTFSERFFGRDCGQAFYSGEVTIERLLLPQDIAGFSTHAQSLAKPRCEMSLLHDDAVRIHVIDGHHADHYQDSIERVYADPPDEWRKIIGDEFWFQYGVFDDRTSRTGTPMDASGRRHMDRQFELAEQNGADLSVGSVRRAIDIGCGWGPVLKYIAERFPACTRIDAVNVSPVQMDYVRKSVERDGLADRVNLYLCNAKDIGALPEPDVPFDLAILRGSICQFTPEVMEDTMAALAKRMRAGGTVIISETLYKTDLATYRPFIPDEVDRGAAGHRKTPEGVRKALESHGFAVLDERILPTNDEVVRWYAILRENIEAHYPSARSEVFQQLHDMSISLSDALEKDKVSSVSFIARRLT
ncbi:TPA: methyltransferase domain-containing protein [Burkholderia territorii]|nr:methyltransferase domain-containing protein [Burkholderia territorii]TXG03262.1 methyltransferase domain-containing protein [Burkholderia territorii]HDR8858033.1 methyltransferase domain-containing protein [Burkholderia territorii]HDR8866472.1 methyltransferase domain-containing protein [Burkholderia territorii]HDR8871672.1 methyltransferase domain-containing protein [Burkholderia territorii]HDR8877118.1 methyltransferase domain-containing protein [Burkholderia territorii]